MAPISFHDLVTELTADQTPRVWSLLVSLFGELAQDADARITGTLLGRLTALMGIKPQAVRVALHRLRKDGWIDSERRGRNSVYALTAWGRTQSVEASPRIYGMQPSPQSVWMVLFDPSEPAPEGPHGVWVTANMLITSADRQWPSALATMLDTEKPLPDWITGRVCAPELVHSCTAFCDRLQGLENSLSVMRPLDLLEVAAIRILIVDGWRRIVLRTPQLPSHVFPAAWSGPDCRRRVFALLSAYPRPSLAALEARP